MSEADNAAVPLEGHMFLYEKPELLSREAHSELGLKTLDNPYAFMDEVRALPITISEIGTAQKYFPIVFSDLENPVPLAVFSVFERPNLFLTDGQWAPDTYLPAYARCHPFALAGQPGTEQLALVIDRLAPSVSSTPDEPFFNAEGLTENTQHYMDYCNRYEADRRLTQTLCEKLKQLDLLSGQQATRTMPDGEEQEIASYVAVDAERLSHLEQDALIELHKTGGLSFAYAQLYSLENWQRLIAREHAIWA